MLEAIKTLDPDVTNMLTFHERFQHDGFTCLVFEMLDMDMHDLLKSWQRTMTLTELRPVASQVCLTAKLSEYKTVRPQ